MKKKPEFKFSSPYQPAGDQPKAIKVLTKSILDGVWKIFSKVERAIQNIPLENGLPVDEAFNKVLNT